MESASDRFDPVARASRLIAPFCTPVSDFGTLRAVDPDAVPEPFRRLLDHSSHMTVVMERFHAAPVSLRVVATNESSGSAAAGEDATRSPGWYAREILLSDPQGRVVQHGIVRIDLKQVQPAVAATIRAATVPLGRILIDAGMLREVHDVRLLEIVPGPHLRCLWADGSPAERVAATVYGRVADISLGGRPAVELLEIVAPGPWPTGLL